MGINMQLVTVNVEWDYTFTFTNVETLNKGIT